MRLLSISSLLIAIYLLLSPTYAASTDWKDLGGGKARLLAVLDPATKRVDAILEVTLEPGWSTYWRYPGSSGIPPRFDFSQSRGFIVEAIAFPAPSLVNAGYEPYAGYKDKVSFPISGLLDTNQASKIELQLLIGVCATVCIPAQAAFAIDIQKLVASDPLASNAVAQAKGSVPQKLPSGTIAVSKSIAATGKLHISFPYDYAAKDPALFVEGPQDWYLTPARLMDISDGIANFSLDVSRVPTGTDVVAEKLVYTLSIKETGIEFQD